MEIIIPEKNSKERNYDQNDSIGTKTLFPNQLNCFLYLCLTSDSTFGFSLSSILIVCLVFSGDLIIFVSTNLHQTFTYTLNTLYRV